MSATHNVNMQMPHFLPAAFARIDHGAKAIGQSLLSGQSGCQHQHRAQQSHMLLVCLHQRNNVLLGYQHEMHGGCRVDVMEGD